MLLYVCVNVSMQGGVDLVAVLAAGCFCCCYLLVEYKYKLLIIIN